MCYSPVLMPSNARYKNLGYRTFNFVPCGHCFQCRTQKADSYYVRAFNEFKLYNDDNCMILFVLLTYNERFLPRVSNDSLDYVGDIVESKVIKHRVSKECPWVDQLGNLCNVDFKPLPTFSTDDIDKFFKKIRSRFLKHLGYVPNISYFLVAENGDKNQRPHYHILFFVDLRKSFYHLVRSIIVDSWTCKVIEPEFVPYRNSDGTYKRLKKNGQPYGYWRRIKTYSRGLVMFDEEDGKQFVNADDPHVSRYLSQYLTNDPYFETAHHENLRQLSPRNQKIYIKKFGPFRLTSKFFGISALWNQSIDKDNAKIKLDDCSGFVRELPVYYYRYIYYSKDDTGRFVRNANYTKLLINRINERYERLLLEFKRFLSHFEKDMIPPGIYKIYENYLSSCICKHALHDFEFYYGPDVHVTAEKLLGYYLIFFLVNKHSSYGNFESCPLPYLDRCHLSSTFLMLDNKQFVCDILAELYKFQQKAPFIGDDKRITDYLDNRTVVYDSLCILFSVWLKFDMVKTNENKFKDWNKKADELGKAKFHARSHAEILY